MGRLQRPSLHAARRRASMPKRHDEQTVPQGRTVTDCLLLACSRWTMTLSDVDFCDGVAGGAAHRAPGTSGRNAAHQLARILGPGLFLVSLRLLQRRSNGDQNPPFRVRETRPQRILGPWSDSRRPTRFRLRRDYRSGVAVPTVLPLDEYRPNGHRYQSGRSSANPRNSRRVALDADPLRVPAAATSRAPRYKLDR